MLRRLLSAALLLAACWSGGAGAAAMLRITELTAADQQRLEHGRMLVARYLPDAEARQHLETVPGKLGVIRAIMRVDPLSPGRHDLAEALGVLFGDTFVQDMRFRWVVIENDSGRHLALRYRRTNVFLYPLDMFDARTRRGVHFDALDLYNDTAADVEEQLDEEP